MKKLLLILFICISYTSFSQVVTNKGIIIDTAAMLSPYLKKLNITAGSNVTLTGSGTDVSPYIIASSGGGTYTAGLGLLLTGSQFNLDTSYGKKYFTYGLLVPNDSTVTLNKTVAVTYDTSITAYKLLGRASGTGVPSWQSSIDSNWIPTLHSEAYYNTKYGSGGGGALSGGVFGRVPYWSSATTLTNDTSFRYNQSKTAASGIAKGLIVNPSLKQAAHTDTLAGIYVNPSYDTTGMVGISRFNRIAAVFKQAIMVNSTVDTGAIEYGLQVSPSDTNNVFGISYKQRNITLPQLWATQVLANGSFQISNNTNAAAGITAAQFNKTGTLATLSGNLQGGTGTGSSFALGTFGGVGAGLWLGQPTPSSSNYSLVNNGSFLILNSGTGGMYFGINDAYKAKLYSTGNLTLGTGYATDNGSTFQVTGSISKAYAAKTGAYTITATDNTINCTSGTFTVTLPTAVSITGRYYTVVNSGSGTITIATTSSQTFVNINTAPTTLTLGAVGAAAITSYTVMSNGANWIVTAKVKDE